MAEQLPPGKDVPVPVASVIEIELGVDEPLPDDRDRRFIVEHFVEIVNFIAPDVLGALAELCPGSKYRTIFAESFDLYLKAQGDRSKELNSNTITQQRALSCEVPNKGRRDFSCVLTLYTQRDPANQPLMMLIASNHRIVPDRKPIDTSMIIDLPIFFRSLSEADLKNVVVRIANRAVADLKKEHKKTLRVENLITSPGLAILEWTTFEEFPVVQETSARLRDFWDVACREVLCGLVSANPDNAELKADIDKIDAFALTKEGEALYDKGDYVKAEGLYRKAISLYAHHSVAHNNLGCALSKLGRHDEAVASMKQALRVDPVNKQASKNLAGILGEALSRSGRTATVHCPLAECDAKISVTLPLWCGSVTGQCETCNGSQVTVTSKGVKETGLLRFCAITGFPVELPQGLLDNMKAEPNGLWPVEEANVLFNTTTPDLVRNHDAIFELELYYVSHGLVPVLRAVLVIQDHPKNPSIVNCLPNLGSPRVISNVRYLKTVDKVKLQVYDAQGRFLFTKDVPVSQADVPNSGGPAGEPLRRISLPRPTWAEYVDALIETAKSMYSRLPAEMRNHRRAIDEFRAHPITCVCEICDRRALTTRSQFRPQDARGAALFDASMLKLEDAVQCLKCNVVFCMECALKRMKADEAGRVINPLTCSVCGQPLHPF